MAEVEDEILKIENWESYSRPVCELDDYLDESSPVKDIKKAFEAALKVYPSAGSKRQLNRSFTAWKKALNGLSKTIKPSDAPQALVYLLSETYDNEEDGHLRASSLHGSDRDLIVHLGMMAKGNEFDLHFGEASYTEEGLSVASQRCNFVGYGVFDYVTDDEEDGGSSETSESKLEMDFVRTASFSISDVTTLNGVPLRLEWPDLDLHRECEGDSLCDEVRRYIVGPARLEDCEPDKELDPYSGDEGGIIHTWRGNCVLITPMHSLCLEFSLAKDVIDKACVALDASSSADEPSNEDRVALDTCLRALRNLSSATVKRGLSSCVASVSRAIIRWRKDDMFLGLLRVCGNRIIFWMGTPCLVKGCETFDWQAIGNFYLNAITNEPSIQLRRELLIQLQDLASRNEDTGLIAWCQLRLEEFINNIQTVKGESGEVDAVLLSLGSTGEILDNLRDKLLPKLYKNQLSDMNMWTALFSRIGSESTLNREAALETIREALKHISPNLRFFPQGQSETSVQQIPHCVADLVGLCARYDVFDVVPPLLQALWAESKCASLTVRTDLYDALIPMLDARFIEHSPLKSSLRLFFADIFHYLLARHSSKRDANLRIALGYLDDPVGTLAHFLHDECKELDDHTLDAIVRFVYLCRWEFCNHADSSAKLRNIIQRVLKARLSTIDVTSVEVGTRPNDSTSVLVFIRLCLDTEHHLIASQALDMCLRNPCSTKAQYIKSQLVPLLRELPGLLDKHELILADTFPQFAGEVVRKFVRHVLGSSPVPDITLWDWKNIGCGCGDCNTLASWIRKFKVGSRYVIRREDQRRRHLIDQLENMSGWGISWKVTGGNPKTKKLPMLQIVPDARYIKVQIPSRFKDLPDWFAKVEQAQSLLRLLGDDTQQKQVLGGDYWSITGAISGQKRPLTSNGRPESSKKPRLG
ncbi:hypothetical protein VNI00_007671 [Paramarasmius palmivorus]|uniref:Uncharacterized protein n=1 Tax=Paramarasmius palmivorus TaxID=297713 RepID=A0AAW0D1Z2_9AGAR